MDEAVGCAFDQEGGAADEDLGGSAQGACDFGEHLAVYAAGVAGPSLRLRTSQGVHDGQAVVVEPFELVAVDHVAPAARGEEQPHLDVACGRGPCSDHRHQRHDA